MEIQKNEGYLAKAQEKINIDQLSNQRVIETLRAEAKRNITNVQLKSQEIEQEFKQKMNNLDGLSYFNSSFDKKRKGRNFEKFSFGRGKDEIENQPAQIRS